MDIQAKFKSGTVAVKEFFHKPQVQKALKITAVALATLAVLAAVICVGLFIFAPVMVLTVPTVIVGVVGAILIGKKAAPRNGPAPAAARPRSMQLVNSLRKQRKPFKYHRTSFKRIFFSKNT